MPEKHPEGPVAGQPGPSGFPSIVTHQEVTVQHQKLVLPIMPPEYLEKYAPYVPDMGERCMRMWEDEAAHRREMERLQNETLSAEIKASRTDRRRGMVLGLGLALVVIGCITYLTLHGADWKGIAGLVVALGGLVWSVRRSTQSELGPEDQAPSP
jgi:uncharacterized membrane protein